MGEYGVLGQSVKGISQPSQDVSVGYIILIVSLLPSSLQTEGVTEANVRNTAASWVDNGGADNRPIPGYKVGLVRGGPWKTAVLVLLLLFFGPDFGGFFAAVPAAQLSALRADPRRTKNKQYRLFA